MAFIYHNGAFIEDDQPALSIHDRIRLGECVFNTILVIDGELQHAGRHMEKVLKNSRLFWGQWDAPEAEALIEMAQSLLEKNGMQSGRFAFNTIMTGGKAGNGLKTLGTPAPEVMMRALPCPEEFPPVEAIIAQSVRRNEGSPLSNIKCGHYGDNILALKEAESAGANEAILLNNAGHVACASTSNIAIMKNGAFMTPPLSDGAMAGVTRAIFLEQYDVEETSITAAQLRNSDEIYLMNSLRGAMPVLELDGETRTAPFLPIPQFFHLD